MVKEFEMSDLENLSYFLGIKFLMTDKGMVLDQINYVREVPKRFRMLESNPIAFPIKANLKFEKNGDENKVDAIMFK